MNFLIVFLGAGLGGIARYAMTLLMMRFSALTIFPVATFTVNIVGSLLMGMLIGLFLMRHGVSDGWKLFFTTGLMGGFTTFSAFSLEVVGLLERGDFTTAIIYAVGSVVLGATALLAGLCLIRVF